VTKVTRPNRGPYWHGGTAGLAVGSLLLPSSITRPGALNTRRQVFVTLDFLTAVWFAITGGGNGGLYQVEPLGRVPDNDYMNDEWVHAFKCVRARILHVIPVPPEFDTEDGFERLRRRICPDEQ
jgi:hypothetical protein